MAPSIKRRSTRQAATRKRSIYVDPETDDDFEVDSEGEFQPEPEYEPPRQTGQPPATKKRKTSVRRKPQTRSTAAKTKQTTLHRTMKIGKPRKSHSEPIAKDFDGPSDGKIPKWNELPIEILKEIFIYASSPIHDYTRESHANVSWLMRTALTCRAFAIPALEAYYQSPAFFNKVQPHHFLDLLRASEPRFLKYNVKVQSLFLDVRNLAYVATGRPLFDICQLVAELPQLQHMEIMHPGHLPPYRPVKIVKWTFSPEALCRAMEERGIHLRSWRWSRNTLPQQEPVDLYRTMWTSHDSRGFAYLKRLVVSGFNVEDSFEPSLPDIDANASPPPGLATSIARLPSLTDLTFISCDVIMEKFLQRLPRNLRRLELSNCLEITSDMLRDFFDTSASQLEELVLKHNAALNLSFTHVLKEKCPRLRVLKVDLHYYSERFTINDAEALYDELLPENEVPSWPPTLRHLEILHAQKWSSQSAQNLFRSLIDSAEELEDLRTLIIHAHINIPWRDRVGFRDQWIERLRRVYLRQDHAPLKNLSSLKEFRIAKAKQIKEELSQSSEDELGGNGQGTDRIYHDRKVSHVLESPHICSGDTDHYTDESTSLCEKSQPRRSKRVAQSHAAPLSRATTPASDSESESSDVSDDEQGSWRRTPEKHVQGLCEMVDIRIDNQRPREHSWKEGDFLDSEASGDEDWHEGAEDEEESYAW